MTFLGRDDRSLMRQVERFTGNKLSLMEIPGLEPRTRIDEPKRQPPKKSWRAASNTRKARGPEERWGRRSYGR